MADDVRMALDELLCKVRLTQGIIFVVRAGKIRSAEFVSEIENISRSGVPILGVVLNGVDPSNQSSLRVYERYYAIGAEYRNGPETVGARRWISRVLPWRV
jgi:Mrp family chromosome partitioning ATPase